jgi:hypothetical protein
MLSADTSTLGRFEVRVEVESVNFLFETSADDGLAEFPGF